MIDKTSNQMNYWRWDNLCASGDPVDCCTPEMTSCGNIQRTSEQFSLYDSSDLRVMIELPNCRQYKPGDIHPVGQLNWDDIINEENDVENCADPEALSSGRSRPGDGDDNDNGKGEEDTQGSEKVTGNGKGTTEGQGNGKVTEHGKGNRKGKPKTTGEGNGKSKGNSKGKDSVTQTPGGNNISLAIAMKLKREIHEADSDMEG